MIKPVLVKQFTLFQPFSDSSEDGQASLAVVEWEHVTTASCEFKAEAETDGANMQRSDFGRYDAIPSSVSCRTRG